MAAFKHCQSNLACATWPGFFASGDGMPPTRLKQFALTMPAAALRAFDQPGETAAGVAPAETIRGTMTSSRIVALSTDEKHIHQKPDNHHHPDYHLHNYRGKCTDGRAEPGHRRLSGLLLREHDLEGVGADQRTKD